MTALSLLNFFLKYLVLLRAEAGDVTFVNLTRVRTDELTEQAGILEKIREETV